MKPSKKELALVIGSLATTFLLVEILLRVFMSPSTISSGSLFGKELPPMRVVPSDWQAYGTTVSKHQEPYRDLKMDGKPITHGDLFGVMREDLDVAYVPLENFESANGWWKSNNLGARRDSFTKYSPGPGHVRTLMFGDSYTQGSRIPQEQSFSAVLEKLTPNTEYLNFGVDGYSTGQAYLRYKQVQGIISFDKVIMTLVPTADLWRNISVSRYFGDRWASYKLQPRYYLEDGLLKLARSPFKDLATQLLDGPNFPVSRKHLLFHDAFYFREYEPSAITDFLVSIRIVKAAIASFKRKKLHREIRDPSGEAVTVTQAIIAAMQRDVIARGATFKLVILPTYADILSYKSVESFRHEWRVMLDALCKDVECIKLMANMNKYKPNEFDFGYDGTHYGASTNRIIAETLKSYQ